MIHFSFVTEAVKQKDFSQYFINELDFDVEENWAVFILSNLLIRRKMNINERGIKYVINVLF